MISFYNFAEYADRGFSTSLESETFPQNEG